MLESWLNSLSFPREPGSEEPRLYLSDENKEDMRKMYVQMVTPCLDYLRKGGVKEISPTTDSNISKSLMNLQESLLDSFKSKSTVEGLSDLQQLAWLQGSFLFAFIWTICGTVDLKGRAVCYPILPIYISSILTNLGQETAGCVF